MPIINIIKYSFISFLLMSCKGGNISYVRSAESIDKKDREIVHDLSKKIIESFKEDDIAIKKKLLSNMFKDDNIGLMDTLSKHISLDKDQSVISVVGEYYVYNRNAAINSVESQFSNHDYTYQFTIKGEETYIYLLELNSSKSGNTSLVSLVFTKVKEDWKLGYIYFAPLKFKSKIGPDFYKDAVKEYSSGNLLKSILFMQTAISLSLPSADRFHYDVENEMADFFKKLTTEFKSKYTFPLKIDNIGSTPEILSISVTMSARAIMPLVIYRTNASQGNISDENKKLDKVINTRLPGIKETADSIAYNVVDANRKSIGTFIRAN